MKKWLLLKVLHVLFPESHRNNRLLSPKILVPWKPTQASRDMFLEFSFLSKLNFSLQHEALFLQPHFCLLPCGTSLSMQNDPLLFQMFQVFSALGLFLLLPLPGNTSMTATWISLRFLQSFVHLSSCSGSLFSCTAPDSLDWVSFLHLHNFLSLCHPPPPAH